MIKANSGYHGDAICTSLCSGTHQLRTDMQCWPRGLLNKWLHEYWWLAVGYSESTVVVVYSYSIHSNWSMRKTNSPLPPCEPARWWSSPLTTQQWKFTPSPLPPLLPQGTIFCCSPRNVTVRIQYHIRLSAGSHWCYHCGIPQPSCRGSWTVPLMCLPIFAVEVGWCLHGNTSYGCFCAWKAGLPS